MNYKILGFFSFQAQISWQHIWTRPPSPVRAQPAGSPPPLLHVLLACIVLWLPPPSRSKRDPEAWRGVRMCVCVCVVECVHSRGNNEHNCFRRLLLLLASDLNAAEAKRGDIFGPRLMKRGLSVSSVTYLILSHTGLSFRWWQGSDSQPPHARWVCKKENMKNLRDKSILASTGCTRMCKRKKTVAMCAEKTNEFNFSAKRKKEVVVWDHSIKRMDGLVERSKGWMVQLLKVLWLIIITVITNVNIPCPFQFMKCLILLKITIFLYPLSYRHER